MQYYLQHTRQIVKYSLLFSGMLIAVVGSTVAQTQAADCAQGISDLDCQALLFGWVDWVPSSCSSSTTGTLTGDDNAQKVFNFFTSHGYTPVQAAGIVGNTSHESGNLPERLQGTP